MRQAPSVESGTTAGFDVPVVRQRVVVIRVGAAVADGAQCVEFLRDAQCPADRFAPDVRLLGNVIRGDGTADASAGRSQFSGDQP